MWKCFWRRRGRLFRLLYFLGLFGFLAFAKYYILYDTRPNERRHSLVQKLQDLDKEKQRLHDFLNQIKLVCKVAKRVGEESMALPICLETKTGKKLTDKFTLISVDESADSTFETEVQNYWEKALVIRLTSPDTENLLMNIQNNLENVSQSDVIILKLNSFASKFVEPDLIRKLSEHHLLDNVQMLHLHIHLSSTHSLIFNWYSELVSLKLNSDLALFYVSENLKNCFDNLNTSHCIVTTSWLRIPDTGVIIPQFSTSDSAQAAMIIDLLTQSYNCSSLTTYDSINWDNKDFSLQSYIRPKRWPLCTSEISEHCNIYTAMFDYSSNNLINEVLNSSCTVHLFDPTLDNKISTEHLFFHQWGFAAKNSSIMSSVHSKVQNWSFRKASDVLVNRNKTVDVLLLDLHGGEWEVIQELASNNALNNVTQIIATVYVWFGEEFFNQLGQYLALQKLRELGFKIYFVEPMIDISNSPVLSSTEKCCFTIGWIK